MGAVAGQDGDKPTRKRIAVLISGRGSNLQALIDACGSPGFPAEIVLVISNIENVEGLTRAERAGIAARTISRASHPTREAFDQAVDSHLRAAGVDLVCLAGFMRVLSNGFVEGWQGRLVNIHPSLLPSFKGLDVHRRILASGVRISGCTVHFVVPEVDSGPIIAQAAVPVLSNDTEESLAARTLAAEHRLYPLAVRLLSEGKATLEDGRVSYADARPVEAALFSPSLSQT